MDRLRQASFLAGMARRYDLLDSTDDEYGQTTGMTSIKLAMTKD